MPRMMMIGDSYINLDHVYAITPKPGYVSITYRLGHNQGGEAQIQVPLGEEKENAKRIAEAIDPSFLLFKSSNGEL